MKQSSSEGDFNRAETLASDQLESKLNNLELEEVKLDAEANEEAAQNGVFGTALAIISTIMGGGIVSIPFAYAVEGVGVGITV